MNSPRKSGSRWSAARRWKVGIGIGCFLIAVSATVPWYETPDAQRFRRLVEVHGSKAVECRRLEQRARAAGRAEDAQILARSARNFEWFSEAYRIRLAQNRLTWLTLLVQSLSNRD